jgi:hypothetical protein
MNFKFKLLTLIVGLFVISIITFNISCTHEPLDISVLDTVCFERDILIPLQSSCGSATGCHAPGSNVEGFDATDHSSIMQYVKKGDPRHSKLYNIITDIYAENMMPPDRPLSKDFRMLIEVWIEQGAENKPCSSFSALNKISIPIKEFWAEQEKQKN